MSIREDMLNVYRNQYTGKIPLGIYSRYLPRSTVGREIRNLGMGIIDYFPVATMVGPPWHFYEGYLSEIKNSELLVKHTWQHGRRIERREWYTPVGTLSGEIEYDPAGAGSEHIRKHYISEPEDYKIISYLVENTVILSNEKNIIQRISDLGDDGVVLGRMDRNPYQKCLIELAGPEQFLVDLFTEPGIVIPLLDLINEKIDEQFEIAGNSEVSVIWQPDNVTTDMTPPDAFRKYCQPFYQKHSAEMKQAGKPYVVHMDGKLKVLQKEIAGSGFDVLESVSIPDMGGDVEITEVQSVLSDMVVVPNFPSNWAVLENNEIKHRLNKWMESFVPEKPVMLQFSEDIPRKEWQRVYSLVTEVVNSFNSGYSSQ